MVEVERRQEPAPTVILERNGTRIGFSRNDGDASQDGAAILVTGIGDIKNELEAKGVKIANWRVDERNGQQFLCRRAGWALLLFSRALIRVRSRLSLIAGSLCDF
jgi:hypothetical protein